MIIESQKRNFGKECQVSAFTLGTMRVANDEKKMYEMIRLAHFSGINHLETAASYGNSETLLGAALNKLNRVDKVNKNKWVLTSKVLPEGNLIEIPVIPYRR